MKFFENWESRLQIAGIALLIIFFIIFGWASIPTLFFPSSHEILYKGEIKITTCKPGIIIKNKDQLPCYTLYELRVGNTGSRDQETVRIKFPRLHSLKGSGHRLLDIFASTKKQPQPVVKILSSRTENIYEISPFPENKVLFLSFYAFGYRDYLALKNMKFRIEARGKVVECDPQTTVLARIFKKIFGFFL